MIGSLAVGQRRRTCHRLQNSRVCRHTDEGARSCGWRRVLTDANSLVVRDPFPDVLVLVLQLDQTLQTRYDKQG
jgi:hypothetical protein